MRVTMADVARVAEVNQATVSRALRGPGHLVREETRQRILRAAEELGYRPDPLVTTLMAQRRKKTGAATGAGTIAVVALWPTGAAQWFAKGTYFERCRDAVTRRARALGYSVDEFPCDGSEPQVRTLLRTLRARGTQGIIFPHAAPEFLRVPFAVDEFACVLLGPGIREPRLARVMTALDFNMRLALRRIRERGHRRIGFATDADLRRKNEAGWMATYVFDQAQQPPELRVGAFEWVPPPVDWGRKERSALRRWIAEERLDAVVSESEVMLRLLREGREELGLFSLERGPEGDFPGIDDNRDHQGETAVDGVVAQLNRGERGLPPFPKRVLIEGRWID